MFGYIRPMKSELKIREFDRFKSIYCGLCHAIKNRYGYMCTFFLSYDVTYLALVLESLEGISIIEKVRCVVNPLKKKCAVTQSKSLDRCADVSVILSYYKILDCISDEKGIKRLKAYIGKFLFRGAFKRACSFAPELNQIVSECISKLSDIEKGNERSIDVPADTFARILSESISCKDDVQRRILREIFYHTGRVIYILDAANDVKEDKIKSNYNPVVLRWSIEDGVIHEDTKKEIELTLSHSVGQIQSALELLDCVRDKGIIENIAYISMPAIIKEVLSGRYKNNGGKIKDEQSV